VRGHSPRPARAARRGDRSPGDRAAQRRGPTLEMVSSGHGADALSRTCCRRVIESIESLGSFCHFLAFLFARRTSLPRPPALVRPQTLRSHASSACSPRGRAFCGVIEFIGFFCRSLRSVTFELYLFAPDPTRSGLSSCRAALHRAGTPRRAASFTFCSHINSSTCSTSSLMESPAAQGSPGSSPRRWAQRLAAI